MGLRDWFRKKPSKPVDPLAAYDARIDALSERAAQLRKSAATLLAVRRDLDRKLEKLDREKSSATARRDAAKSARDDDAASVLSQDLSRLDRDRDALGAQREKVAVDAQQLAEAVIHVEQESEQLQRERDGARVQMAASGAIMTARPALDDRIDELIKLDAARDEVERAHALADIYREDAKARRTRERA